MKNQLFTMKECLMLKTVTGYCPFTPCNGVLGCSGVSLLNGTALSTQGSGNPELLEGTKRKCDPSSAS